MKKKKKKSRGRKVTFDELQWQWGLCGASHCCWDATTCGDQGHRDREREREREEHWVTTRPTSVISVAATSSSPSASPSPSSSSSSSWSSGQRKGMSLSFLFFHSFFLFFFLFVLFSPLLLFFSLSLFLVCFLFLLFECWLKNHLLIYQVKINVVWIGPKSVYCGTRRIVVHPSSVSSYLSFGSFLLMMMEWAVSGWWATTEVSGWWAVVRKDEREVRRGKKRTE